MKGNRKTDENEVLESDDNMEMTEVCGESMRTTETNGRRGRGWSTSNSREKR